MSSYAPKGKPSLKPKRHHGYAVLLFILGTLFPPLAVAARFGFGGDFWLNLLLTICGYIPGHGHNFYIQNIRNNKTHQRTPKWAQRYGLIDTSKIKRNERKSQWATRYNERLPESTLEGQAYEEGEVVRSTTDGNASRARVRPARGEGLWREDEESYYGHNGDSGSTRSGESAGGRWHYPANFDDAIPTESTSSGKKKKSSKKDRWARTEDAYAMPIEDGRKKKKKRKSSRSKADDGDSHRSESINEFPEDAEGGLYGNKAKRDHVPENPPIHSSGPQDELEHQF